MYFYTLKDAEISIRYREWVLYSMSMHTIGMYRLVEKSELRVLGDWLSLIWLFSSLIHGAYSAEFKASDRH